METFTLLLSSRRELINHTDSLSSDKAGFILFPGHLPRGGLGLYLLRALALLFFLLPA